MGHWLKPGLHNNLAADVAKLGVSHAHLGRDTEGRIPCMASAIPPRLLSRGVIQICRHRPVSTPLNIRRAASSKHPKGFVPPAKEDLDELRDRVQEFTSMLFLDECDELELNSACRA